MADLHIIIENLNNPMLKNAGAVIVTAPVLYTVCLSNSGAKGRNQPPSARDHHPFRDGLRFLTLSATSSAEGAVGAGFASVGAVSADLGAGSAFGAGAAAAFLPLVWFFGSDEAGFSAGLGSAFVADALVFGRDGFSLEAATGCSWLSPFSASVEELSLIHI